MNSTKDSHTPTPYSLEPSSGLFNHVKAVYIVAARPLNGDTVIATCTGPDHEANGAFILRAVNSHASLVAALERIKSLCDAGYLVASKDGVERCQHVFHQARSALASAKL